jgi:hypothetical protein
MTVPRVNPEHAWTAFQQHLGACSFCTIHGECPEGAALLKVWGEADTRVAAEQAAIEAVEDCADERPWHPEL